MYSEGATDAEVHEAFPTWAEGTFRNLRGRNKDRINDPRRAKTVQFTDIPGVRKQTRLNDSWELRTIGKMLIAKHLESCYAADPVTGEQEFVERLVDNKRLKDYYELILKANTAIMIETGQQLRLDDKWTETVLGVDGRNGVDYPQIVADLPRREREEKALAAAEAL